MITRRAFAAGILAAPALVGNARASAIMINLVGDSIVQGWGLKAFPSEVPADHRLWILRSIWSTANFALEECGSPVRFSQLASKIDDPDTPGRIARFGQGGALSGDWIVIEDAGAHGGDPALYRATWQAVVDAIPDGARAAAMTMFDYPPAPADSQYDRVLTGGVTMNGVIRSIASDNGLFLIDMNASMDRFHGACRTAYGVSPVHPDGIHPNVWGQMHMVGAILAATGLQPVHRARRRLIDLVRRNFDLLRYDADARWSANAAEHLASTVFGAP